MWNKVCWNSSISLLHRQSIMQWRIFLLPDKINATTPLFLLRTVHCTVFAPTEHVFLFLVPKFFSKFYLTRFPYRHFSHDDPIYILEFQRNFFKNK
jgi:hypothetical protein